jgi:hypothetical protein
LMHRSSSKRKFSNTSAIRLLSSTARTRNNNRGGWWNAIT